LTFNYSHVIGIIRKEIMKKYIVEILSEMVFEIEIMAKSEKEAGSKVLSGNGKKIKERSNGDLINRIIERKE